MPGLSFRSQYVYPWDLWSMKCHSLVCQVTEHQLKSLAALVSSSMLLLLWWLFSSDHANNRYLIPRAWLLFRPYSGRGLVASPFWGKLAFRFGISFAYTSPSEIYCPMRISLKVEAFLRKALWYWPHVCFEVTSLLLMTPHLPVHRPVAHLPTGPSRGLVALRSWYSQ